MCESVGPTKHRTARCLSEYRPRPLHVRLHTHDHTHGLAKRGYPLPSRSTACDNSLHIAYWLCQRDLVTFDQQYKNTSASTVEKGLIVSVMYPSMGFSAAGVGTFLFANIVCQVRLNSWKSVEKSVERRLCVRPKSSGTCHSQSTGCCLDSASRT